MIPLSMRGREITRTDMDRCANVAGTIHLPFDREIIHRIVQRYSVDDKPWIKTPLGLYGSRLACEVYVITADANHMQNIYKCINNAGYDLKEIVFAGMADGAALLDKDDKGSRVLLLDMGASLTEVCVFLEGILSDLEIVPIGADNIKDNFRDSEQFAGLLSKISAKRQAFNVSSVILTGGAAFIDSLIEFIEEKLSCKVSVGVTKDIKGDISSVDSVRVTTAIGLVKYACENRAQKSREAKNFPRRISSAVVDLFNNYF
jgi:cell division ATPase FtsA